MRLTCPCCGAAYSIEVLLADRAAREAVSTALALPAALGDRLLRYLALFRPAERALSWSRAARLLSELQAAIAAARIERDGRLHPAPADYWKAALDQMLDHRDRLSLPLKSHGYLYEIIVGLGQRAENQRAARQEVADERARAREGTRTGQPQSAATLAQTEILAETRPSRVPPPESFRALSDRLMKGIGSKPTDAGRHCGCGWGAASGFLT